MEIKPIGNSERHIKNTTTAKLSQTNFSVCKMNNGVGFFFLSSSESCQVEGNVLLESSAVHTQQIVEPTIE